MLEIRDFTFRIKTKTILDGVTLSVGSGEYVTIVGPNGAGKSTLLKCISRIYRGGAGQISLNGRPLLSYSQPALARAVSYVPQASNLSFSFTVSESRCAQGGGERHTTVFGACWCFIYWQGWSQLCASRGRLSVGNKVPRRIPFHHVRIASKAPIKA